MSDEAFERHVELLNVLVENFVSDEKGLISQVTASNNDPADYHEAEQRPPVSGEDQAIHPQVDQALRYIEQHLTDPKMTVANIARHLGMNSTYLAHLFSRQVGTRMSRHITNKRIELAKELLATTDDQIKQVAYKTGHGNPDWFSQVFHSQTGLTPREYRRKALSRRPR
jgi:transcriptional regulator GlxA family with amidase domain